MKLLWQHRHAFSGDVGRIADDQVKTGPAEWCKKGRPDAVETTSSRPCRATVLRARHVQRVSRNIHRGDIGVGEGKHARMAREATRPGTQVKHTGDAGRVVDAIAQSTSEQLADVGSRDQHPFVDHEAQSHLLGETST